MLFSLKLLVVCSMDIKGSLPLWKSGICKECNMIFSKKKQELPDYVQVGGKSKKKQATGFTIMIIPDSSDPSKRTELSFDTIVRTIASVSAVLIVVFGLLISVLVKNYKLTHFDDGSAARIESLEVDNARLQSQVKSLGEQVDAANAVFEQLKEQDAAKEAAALEDFVPRGVPLKGGQALVITDDSVDFPQEDILYQVLSGTVLVATGSGTVTEVASDELFGRRVTMDHGNGYITVYYTNAEIQVNVGDILRKNDMLGVMVEEDGRVCYEMYANGQRIDPRMVMDS